MRKHVLFHALALIAIFLRALRWVSRLGRDNSKQAIVVEPFGMGDIISLLPLLKALNEEGWRVAILAKRQWQDLVPQEHYEIWIPTEFPWASYSDCKKYHSFHLIWNSIFAVKRQLQGFTEAVGIDPRGDIRSIILLYTLGCRDVATMGRYSGSGLCVPSLAAVTAQPIVPEKHWHEVLYLLPCIGLAMPSVPMPPRITSHEMPVSDLGKVIALIPVAPWPGKHWPASHWRHVISRLRSRQRSLVALCGPGQVSDVARLLGGEENVIECANIKEWEKQLSSAIFVLTVDTGPMHLAAALGIPTVSLFGVTPLPLWAPGGEQAVVVHPHSDPRFRLCQQVEKNTSLGKNWMAQVSPEEVLEVCESILGS